MSWLPVRCLQRVIFPHANLPIGCETKSALKRLGARLAAALLITSLAVVACARGAPPPDPSNELPFGAIDLPRAGATVQRKVGVHGWALDDRGIREIRIFANGHYVASTRLTIARPDVTKAYPAYARGNDRHGWGVEITLPPRTEEATIVAQAVDTQGLTADLGKVSVKVLP